MWLLGAAETGIYNWEYDNAAIIRGTGAGLAAYSLAYRLEMPVSSTDAI
jgi:hypothetical protein